MMTPAEHDILNKLLGEISPPPVSTISHALADEDNQYSPEFRGDLHKIANILAAAQEACQKIGHWRGAYESLKEGLSVTNVSHPKIVFSMDGDQPVTHNSNTWTFIKMAKAYPYGWVCQDRKGDLL